MNPVEFEQLKELLHVGDVFTAAHPSEPSGFQQHMRVTKVEDGRITAIPCLPDGSDMDGWNLHTYRCKQCGGYHEGHSDKFCTAKWLVRH